MENIKGECNDNAETSASINKNLDIPLITKKKLNLRVNNIIYKYIYMKFIVYSIYSLSPKFTFIRI